ncbi:sensor histidine kinase [Clostridium aceticum]|uniref:histidine kinase n=1 Tax=Clostridium aceticum TaxID=84022 RepID=A0A0D8IB55_9CLOT|nr:HAMP domain-containing sensor histidine kinase [Clostridium aceticum]AKL96583.1 sensor histidine kinase [Clostridium aceticum]KJF27262.1 hypothetical protein TZ02_07900 [Clostridium aceticum]
MTHKKHLTMFLVDHLWIILLFVVAPVGFMLLYLLLSDAPTQDALYYIFLSLVILFSFLAYRLYSTWNLYELFCSDKKDINEFIISEPKSNDEKRYKKLISKIRQIYLNDMRQLEEERKSHRLMIYRWVHQLKTPLSVIHLIAENQKTDEDYNKILHLARKIQYDLNQVLDLYKLEAIENNFHAERVNLYDMSKDCINELKSIFIEREVYPKLDIDKELFVYTDYKWIKFVLYQLLTNAVKYSDNGKSVVVFATKTDGLISLCVKDRGCGIEKSDLSRIFNLYFTGNNGRHREESSGLGLYMVKQILDYLGHSISVESTPSIGSVFTVNFNVVE